MASGGIYSVLLNLFLLRLGYGASARKREHEADLPEAPHPAPS